MVIANDEGQATFKQLKKYGKTRVLHPLNPKYDDMALNKPLTNRIFVKGKDIEYRADLTSRRHSQRGTLLEALLTRNHLYGFVDNLNYRFYFVGFNN